MSNTSTDHIDLKWETAQPIAVPSASREKRMAIRAEDWQRLMRHLKQVSEPTPRLSIVYSLLFGAAITTGFSILANTRVTTPDWLQPVYYAVLFFTLIFGFIFVMLDRWLKSAKKSSLSEIVEDMASIEGMFKQA